MKLTKVRRIEGDVNVLRTDLKEALGLDEKEISINQLTKQIIVKVCYDVCEWSVGCFQEDLADFGPGTQEAPHRAVSQGQSVMRIGSEPCNVLQGYRNEGHGCIIEGCKIVDWSLMVLLCKQYLHLSYRR